MRSPSDPHGGYVTEIAFSADGDHLLVGTACFAVRVWGALSGEVMLFCPPLAGTNEDGGYHAGKLSCDIVATPDRRLLMAAGSASGGIIVWDCSEGCRIAELRNCGHPYGVPVPHLAAYPSGRYFLSADLDTIKVWWMDDFKCKRTLRSAFVVQILLVSDKDKYIFCAGQIEDKNKQKQKKPDGVVAVWPGHPEKKPIRLLRGFGRLVRSLYAPVDPDVLVTAGQDGRVKIWDVPTGQCRKAIWSKLAMASPLAYAALVNRARWLLTYSDDASLQIWAVDSGKCLLTLATTSIGITPKFRLSASRCGRLVAVATGNRIQVIDFEVLADRSKAGRPGEPAAYLKHALRFIVTAPST
ncbi:unnamed protein product, partial [Sphacelaria rigidula]